MNNKHKQQMQRAKASLNLLQMKIELAEDYQEMLNEFNIFMKFFQQQANERNNRPNKSIQGFINYFNNNAHKKRSIEKLNETNKVKKLTVKLTYKDYIPDYLILRKKGMSYKKISEYSLAHFKIKVSKDTIRNNLKGLE